MNTHRANKFVIWIGTRFPGLSRSGPPEAIYRDLVAPLFTMAMPILGFGALFTAVTAIIWLRWRDPTILVLGLSAAVLTILRLALIRSYHLAGGQALPIKELRNWERLYTYPTLLFAVLLAALNVQVLMVHEPLMVTGTVSLVFTFGAGVVSRTSCRPLACIGSLLVAVLPTAVAMLWHAALSNSRPTHAEFYMLFGLLLLAVLTMSLDSVRQLYNAMLEQLTTKHDLARLARFDALTGLPNRLMLREAYHTRLYAAQRFGGLVAVHYLDLDGFKGINDQFGHPTGDKMLRQVADRLRSTLRSNDVVARLGGDEFVIIQADVSHQDEAELLARRIIKQLSEVYVIESVQMRISVSIGIALVPTPDIDLDDVLTSADASLYRAKAGGKAQLQFCHELRRGGKFQSSDRIDSRLADTAFEARET